MIVQNLSGAAGPSCRSACRSADLERALTLTRGGGAAHRSGGARRRPTPNIARLFVLGVGMRTHTGVARRMFGALAERGINISMINTSEVRVSVVVDHGPRRGSARCLKEAFQLT